MRSTLPSVSVSGLLGVLLLSGCATTPGQPTEPEPTLTEAAFDARISQLEQTLIGRCERTDAHMAQVGDRHRMLTADVREVGSLLRHLRGDVDQLVRRSDEPVVVNTECRDPENDPLEGKTLLGRAEWVGLPDIGTYLKARIDSGATTSSLSASDVTRFERDGEDWVRFKLALSDEDDVVDAVRGEWVEAPVEGRVRVGQAEGESSRPVVSLVMTLGPIQERVDFALTNRTHPDYPVQLGHRFLMDLALIDVSEAFLHPRPEFAGGGPTDEAIDDATHDQDREES